MRKTLLTLLLLAAVTVISYTQYFKKTNRDPASLGLSVDRYLSYLPEGYRNGAREYLQMMGQGSYEQGNVWGANSGIVSFNIQLLDRNQCFRNLARTFYESIPAYTHPQRREGNITFSLVDSTQNSTLESGWLWRQALQYAGGNANLAMTLIGLCGHDNVHQFPNNYNFRCPSSNGAMYLQGALGEETILSDRTTRQLINYQAPLAGGEALPSKYFHVMGAAYLTCSLVRAGIPNLIVRQLQRGAINTYRAMRLCETVRPREFCDPISNMNSTQFMTLVRNFRTNPESCVTNLNSGQNWREFRQTPECVMLGELEEFVGNETIGYSELRRHFEAYMGRIVASRLFREQIMNPEHCNQIQWTRSTMNRLQRFSLSGSCGSGVSVQRCQEAQRVMRSWWMDFVWSEEQHRMGTDFAINNCTNDPSFIETNLERHSCESLQQLHPPQNNSSSEIQVEQ